MSPNTRTINYNDRYIAPMSFWDVQQTNIKFSAGKIDPDPQDIEFSAGKIEPAPQS